MAELDPDVPIPQPTASDPEDVSWALSTAEAMWARGDVAEAVKWLRRGAEAASEAEADERALELAKAAANLASRVPRRSNPSMSLGSSAAALLEATPQAGPLSPSAPIAPLAPARKLGSSLPPQPGTTPPRGVASTRPSPSARPSAPSRPLPLRASSSALPPPASSPPGPGSTPPAPSNRPHSVPVPTSALESGRFAAHVTEDPGFRSEGRVRLATQPDEAEEGAGATEGSHGHGGAAQGFASPRNAVSSPGFDDKTLGRIHAQRDPESDGDADTSSEADDANDDPWEPPPPSSDPRPGISENTAQMPALTELNAIEVLRGRRPLKALASSASDWDAVPTKTLSGADFPEILAHPPPVAAAVAGPVAGVSPPQSQPPPSSDPRPRGSGAIERPSSPPPSVRPDDRRPPLATSQALRLVLWKDANGVHVAPQGTRVSAITVDVMVVALDPSVDIRAWLDPTHRKHST